MDPWPTSTSIDAAEVEKLSANEAVWWDAKGGFAPLHAINPVRLAFIRGQFLGQATQAEADLDEAARLRPDDQEIKRSRDRLSNQQAVHQRAQGKK